MDFGVGYSTQVNIPNAGQEAAKQAMMQMGSQKPDLTLVFADVRYADPRLLKGVRSMTESAPLIGCTSAGGIHTSTGLQRAVMVIVLRAPQGRLTIGCGRHLSRNPEAAIQELCGSFQGADVRKAKALCVFPDGLSGNGCEILRQLQRHLGQSLPILGGCAADDGLFQKTFQFYEEDVLTDAVPGVLMSGTMTLGIGVGHGWEPLGTPRQVTKADGRFLRELDRRPAISVYEEYLGIKKDELTEEPIANVSMMYPLGVVVSTSEPYLLRDSIAVDPHGALVCTGELREGSHVRLMIGGQESVLGAARQAAEQAVGQIGLSHVKGALVFCGIARRRLLGGEFDGEIDVIRDALGGVGVRMGGFYTYGELAPTDKGAQFHNESVVVVALG